MIQAACYNKKRRNALKGEKSLHSLVSYDWKGFLRIVVANVANACIADGCH